MTQKIQKAQLIKIKWDDGNIPEEVKDSQVNVQFNPETLKVNYANQLSGGNSSGSSAKQFVGSGTTKLSLDLWFDVTVQVDKDSSNKIDDVRILTKKIIDFITPKDKQKTKKKNEVQYIPPGVRFIWGSFMFDGVMDSINENLEFFSEDGMPLRASVSISIASQEIQFKHSKERSGPQGTKTPGTQRGTQNQDKKETLPPIPGGS